MIPETRHYSRLELAIEDVYQEICKTENLCFWREKSETELLNELVICILGSRVSNEVAVAAASNIEAAGVIQPTRFGYFSDELEEAVATILENPLSGNRNSRGARYPFPKSRANYISRTLRSLHSTRESLSGLLNATKTPQEARRWFIDKFVGIGPKQASLFLRNVGYTNDLAILDSHILRFMYLIGLIDHRVKSPPNLRLYEMYELLLQKYALLGKRCMGQLDLAIWVVMRVYGEGVRQ